MKRDPQEKIDGERSGIASRTDSSSADERALSDMIFPYHRDTKVGEVIGISNTRKNNDVDRIKSCLETIAELVENDEAYLPIFLRLEAEFRAAINRQRALERAKSYRRRKS